MKKIVCGCLGTIFYATINPKTQTMRDSGRIDVTNDAITAVLDHIQTMPNYDKRGYAGYAWAKKDNSGNIKMIVYDDTKYKLIPIEQQPSEQ